MRTSNPRSIHFHKKSYMRAVGATVAVVLLSVAGVADYAYAGPFAKRDMAGGRIGAWVNTGDEGTVTGINGVQQTVSSANLFAELFYSHAFSNFFRADVGIGVSNRSDITATTNTFTGGINIYPVQLGLRVYPLGGTGLGKLYPYVLGGVGLYIGSQTGSSFRSLGIASSTATDLNYVVGGGIDIPVASTIAIATSAKYYQIDFGSDGFLGLQNYSGYSITAGVAYLFPTGGKKKR